MITPAFFYQYLFSKSIEFYAGVPDSLLKKFCAYLTANTDGHNHIIAANEGAAIGLAAGYHLATGQIPVVYMQNSGLGNTVNPLLSLMDKEVYNIPVLLLIGWRGEPGVKDEPQHIKQGKVTCELLETMGIRYEIMETDETALATQLEHIVPTIQASHEPHALIVRKNSFADYTPPQERETFFELSREDAIQEIAAGLNDTEIIVSTTGMISRELFEYRETASQGHERDFLTVGSMGHASQIALGIALQRPERKIFCFDGDGAAIMHLGSWGIIGQTGATNYHHIVFNNGAHDSVGGQPTVGLQINFRAIASACGYKTTLSISTRNELKEVMTHLDKYDKPLLLEIKVRKGARKNLGRPTTPPHENKENLMRFLRK